QPSRHRLDRAARRGLPQRVDRGRRALCGGSPLARGRLRVDPGVVLRYQWDGTEFGGHQWAPEYPPILPAGEAGQGPPVMLGPVAVGLGCPDGTVRFGRDGTATVAGATYDLA